MKKLVKFTRYAITVFIVLFFGNTNANSVYGYQLGMSNAEAAKIGLIDCKDATSFSIECKGRFPQFVSGSLSFDKKSRRLTSIVIGSHHGMSDRDRVMRDLKLPQCPDKNLDEVWRSDPEICHFSSGLRSIKWQRAPQYHAKGTASFWLIELRYRPGEDVRYRSQVRLDKKKAEDLASFQRGQ